MSLPERLATERLRLVHVTAADVADMVAGRHQDRWHADYPRPDDVDAARLMREAPAWGPWHIVAGSGAASAAVGSIGLFGPPEDGEVEVGFGLVAPARGHGFATEALRGLLAALDPHGLVVRARAEPDNRASVRVLAKAGFTDLRGADEDGLLVLARPAAAAV